MLIVQIGPYPLSREIIRGGVEASVFGLAQQQAKAEEVHAFDNPRIKGRTITEQDGNVLVHRFCNAGKHHISNSRQIKAIAEEISSLKPDVCHIHGTGFFSWLMYRRLKKIGLKTVVTVHGLVRVEKRNLLKKKFSLKRLFQYLYQGQVEKHFLSQIPEAIVDTEYVKEMVNNYPISKKPIMYVIPQGINEEYFRISCSDDSSILLSVGAIGERKGHLLTLKSFELVRQSGIDCKLRIVGAVASRAYYERLLESINKSSFCKDVELHVEVTEEQLKQLYKDSHIFVLHTEEESQGIVFAEAMATGMPVVATNAGGVPYVVKNGETGLLSEYGDVVTFSDNIKRMMTDEKFWHDMSASSKSASTDYHWSNICEKVNILYDGAFNT